MTRFDHSDFVIHSPFEFRHSSFPMLLSRPLMISPHAIPAARPPVILLGMHRSGTSLIARVLDQLGLFQGSELQEDHESVYFLDVNDTLMKRIGASWDNPSPA